MPHRKAGEHPYKSKGGSQKAKGGSTLRGGRLLSPNGDPAFLILSFLLCLVIPRDKGLWNLPF